VCGGGGRRAPTHAHKDVVKRSKKKVEMCFGCVYGTDMPRRGPLLRLLVQGAKLKKRRSLQLHPMQHVLHDPLLNLIRVKRNREQRACHFHTQPCSARLVSHVGCTHNDREPQRRTFHSDVKAVASLKSDNRSVFDRVYVQYAEWRWKHSRAHALVLCGFNQKDN
jgi:hypothetical protein